MVAVTSAMVDTRAQAQVPQDVAQAITDLGAKLKGLQTDRAKLAAAISQLDGVVDPLRSQDDNVARSIKVLTDWLSALKEPKDDARKQLAGLLAQIDAMPRDKTPAEAAIRLSGPLATALGAPFSDTELTAVQKAIQPIGPPLDKIISKRAPRVHIISAKFGDFRTGRTCDAMPYFQGRCDAQKTCPPDTTTVISGSEVCGFDPAPLASDSVKEAQVTYKCINMGLRPWADIVRDEAKGGGSPAKLHGKGRIVCDPRPE